MSKGPPEQLYPEDVFTPRAPVSREMFARRLDGQLQIRLEECLREQGAQVVLYGDTGAGKTTLLTHVAEDLGFRVIRVECLTHMTFEDLADAVVSTINRLREVKLQVEESRSQEGEAEGEMGLSLLAKVRAKFRALAG